MPARTTVVMMTRNRRDELLRTLRHMTTLPDRAPIILVDNASTDGLADAVARLHPDVELIGSDQNLGAVARNLAVRRVRTPYVAFCDDDTRWQPGALSRAADLLDRHPGLGSVTGRCLVEPALTEDPITPEMRHSPIPPRTGCQARAARRDGGGVDAPARAAGPGDGIRPTGYAGRVGWALAQGLGDRGAG